jgi:glycosyltransferase involved in cell wall biosynthesis
MKLALLSPYPRTGEQPRGGVETAATRLVQALAERGVEVTVIALQASSPDRTGPAPPLVLPTDSRLSLARDLRPMRKELARMLHAVAADVVHAQGLVPAGFAATHTASNGAPRVITAHGSRREDTLAAYDGVGARARWLLGRRMVARASAAADAIVGVHPEWSVNLLDAPARFVYIPNIVADAFFDAPRTPVAGRVLYCGGTAAIKGWDLLLSAWPRVLERFPGARLHAVGCATARHDIPAPVASSIDADPWLDPQQLLAALSCAELVVLPSRYEVAPIALSEAWAARTPVVATAVGGVPALATGAARLVEPSPAALADALVHALAEPHDALVAEGFRRSQLQRRDAVAAAHLDLYRSLLAARS